MIFPFIEARNGKTPPEIKFSFSTTPIDSLEKELFINSVANFLDNNKSTVQESFSSDYLPFSFSTTHSGACSVRLLQFNDFMNDLFLKHIFTSIPSNEQKLRLLNYVAAKGKIIMIQRTQPSKEFKENYQAFSNKFHLGLDFASNELIAKYLSERNSPEKASNGLNNEEKTIENLMIIAGSTIKFYPITPVDNFEEVQSAVNTLHAISDQHEFNLAVKTVSHNKEKLDVVWTTLLSGISYLVLPPILDRALKYNSVLSKTSIQFFGDLTDMVKNAFDRNEIATQANIRVLLNSVAQNMKSLPKIMLEKDKAITILGVLAIGLLGSFLSELTRNDIFFYAVSPLCAIPVNFREMSVRLNHAKETIQSHPELTEAIEEEYPKILKFIPNKSPIFAMALHDYYLSNPVAFGSAVGSPLSFLLLQYNNLPESLRVTLGGVVIQLLTGGLLGLYVTAKNNPEKKFLEEFSK